MKKLVLGLLSCLIGLVSFSQGDQTIINVPISSTATELCIQHLPDDYATTTNKYPLIVFLHGAGQSTPNPSDIYTSQEAGGPSYYIAQGQWPSSFINPLTGTSYKFIVMSPQSYPGGWSTTAPQLDYVLTYLYANYRVDTTRVYVTGLSAGGEGTVEYVGQLLGAGPTFQPSHHIAAIVPMSAVMNGNQLQPMADTIVSHNIGLWGFGSLTDTHGANTSSLVYYANVYRPGYARFTSYSGGHCCWGQFYTPTYTESVNGTTMNIYQWMLTNSLNTTAPSASAGPNQTITLPTSSTTLVGSGTAGTGHTISTYAWVKTSGSGSTITSPSSAVTTVTGLTAGTYVYTLTVTQNDAQTAVSSVTITVNASTSPPVVNAGPDQTITAPASSVTLTGAASGLSGATITSTTWSQVSGPNSATFSSASTTVTSVSGLIIGSYQFRLTAVDNNSHSSSDTMVITVLPIAVGGAAEYQIANGEYGNYILNLYTKVLYGVGSGANGIGTNTGFLGLPIQCMSTTAGNNFRVGFVAAGLHTTSCTDTLGNVYFAGLNEDGSSGQGNTSSTNYPSYINIPTDTLGNPFTNVTYLAMGSSIFTGGAGYGAIIYAIKSDGTLWVWGNTQGGYRGDSTYGHVNTRPAQVKFPAGTVITKIRVSNIALALDSAGNVWTWGGDVTGSNGNGYLLGDKNRVATFTYPVKIVLPHRATDIAGGGLWSFAVLNNGALYGWGFYTGYMGMGANPSSSAPDFTNPGLPFRVDSTNGISLPAPIKYISSNNTTNYVILTNGTLWSWGGNEAGQAGNGQEINWPVYTTNPSPYGGTNPAPYNWNQDMSVAQLQQHKPVQIAQCQNNFIALSEGASAVYYKFVEDVNHTLYSWGRNKTGVLANGVIEKDFLAGTLGALYPNSWDVDTITAVYPFYQNTNFGSNILSTSPWCNTNPTATGCPGTIPTNNPPTVSAGANQNIFSTSTLNLSGGATPNGSGVVIAKQVWSLMSPIGCPSVIFVTPYSLSTTVLGAAPGFYTFKLTVTDSNGNISTSTVQVFVSSAVPNKYVRQKAAVRKYKVINLVR